MQLDNAYAMYSTYSPFYFQNIAMKDRVMSGTRSIKFRSLFMTRHTHINRFTGLFINDLFVIVIVQVMLRGLSAMIHSKFVVPAPTSQSDISI